MTWEYLSFRFRVDELGEFQDKLNNFGRDGWELTSLVPTKMEEASIFEREEQTSHFVVVFKRPKA